MSDSLQASVEEILTVVVDQHHRAREIVFFEERQCRRYGEFVTENGWMMLSILANSASFRNDARQLDDDSWNLLCNCLLDNFNSLEIFAKVRSLDWKTPLTKREEYGSTIEPNLREAVPELRRLDSLHGYIVPQGPDKELERPQYEVQFQTDVQNNFYQPIVFDRVPKPTNWPPDLEYPSDPTTVTYSQCCDICELAFCTCEPQNCDAITKPLVELKRYHEKGVGVRALEYLRQGDILAEYTGLIVPNEAKNPKYRDNVYGYAFSRPGSGDIFAMISAKLYGNWTRYISHSCDANTTFRPMAIGERYRVMIVAVKDIDIFEEVTVDYGPHYFLGRHPCLCGEQCCRYRDIQA